MWAPRDGRASAPSLCSRFRKFGRHGGLFIMSPVDGSTPSATTLCGTFSLRRALGERRPMWMPDQELKRFLRQAKDLNSALAKVLAA